MKSSGICLDVDAAAIESGIDRSRYHHILSATDTLATRGKFGKGTLFNGTTSFVDCGNNACLNITKTITIEVGIKHSGTLSEAVGIVAKDDATIGEGYGIYKKGSTGLIKIHMRIGITWKTVEDLTISNDGLWHHFVATYDGANICLYRDGSLVNSDGASGSIDTNSYALKIGIFEGSSYKFNGTIDEVRIYNRALSATEIKRNYLSKAYLYVPHPVRIP